MKRTIIRHSIELNQQKYDKLNSVVSAYSKQKNAFLNDYAHIKYLNRLTSNTIRDNLVKSGFVSPFGLKARAWKLALKDALQTILMYWKATMVEVIKHIYRNKNISKNERKIALGIVNNLKNVKLLFNRELNIDTHLQNYLIRKIRKSLGNRPTVNLSRSAAFDADMYRVFDNKGTQYISLTSLERKRVIVPLKGHQKISGNIRIVLIEGIIEVHVTQEVRIECVSNSDPIGIDLGLSELFTDSDGDKWYPEFWSDLRDFTEPLNNKMKNRNKIHAHEKSLRESDPSKAKRIRENNLGKKKLNKRRDQFKGRVKTEVNTAINRFMDSKRPSVVTIEDLSHYKPPIGCGSFSRHASIWMRNTINDRFIFKTMVRGSNLKYVNSAYTSQTCSVCGYVDRRNRKGDKFQCLRCGSVMCADHNASINILGRSDDDEIKLLMEPWHVKSILLRRLEGDSNVPTVPGKTLDTNIDESTNLGQSKSETTNKGMFFYV